MNKKITIPDNINWEYLKRFKICAESNTFKEAYEKIGTSPSGLNNQLDVLEEELKIKLFERSSHNRSINLTLQGQFIYNIVKDIELHLQGLSKIHRSPGIEENLELKIVTTQGLADTILADPTEIFIEKYPNVKVDIKTELTPRQILPDEIMIRSDFAIQDKCERKFIFNHKMNLYASKKYIDKYGQPMSFSDLIEHKNLILSNMNARNTNWATLSSGNLFLMYYITSDSIKYLFDMCVKGKGILELPSIYPGVDKLTKLLEDEPSPSIDIYVGGLRETFLLPHIIEFINILKQSWGKK